jgi:GMP synthase (glutamine-hydrolysing)
LSYVNAEDAFFKGVPTDSQVWMSHADTILNLPENAECLASTSDVENAAYKLNGEPTYGIQFHPEVYHSTDGKQVLRKLFGAYCRRQSKIGLRILLWI